MRLENMNNSDLLEHASCNFCQGANTRFLFSGTDRQHRSVPSDVWCDAVRCNECGLTYLSPRVKEKYIGQFYPESEYYTQIQTDKKSGTGVFKDELFRSVARLYFNYPFTKMTLKMKLCAMAAFRLFPFRYHRILPYMPDGRLIDFGFGNGDYLCRMQDLGWECWGVERNKTSLRNMDNRGIRAFSDLSDSRIPRNYFDWVTAYHSLEHVYDPLATLQCLYEILKPGGRLYLGVPNFGSFAARIFGSYWYDLGVPIHPYIYTTSSIYLFLKKCGFKNINIQYRSLTQGLLGSAQLFLNAGIGMLNNRKYTKMFLRDNLLLQILCLPFVKVIDYAKLGDRIEVIAYK
jgi:SAM-dependent methyltransferase